MIVLDKTPERYNQSVIVPAGKYVLGDPCYAVPDELWEDLLDRCDCFVGNPVGTVKGHSVLGFSTAYGDGCYVGSDWFEYCVDAGLIGLVPYTLAEGKCWKGLSRVLEFNEDTVCTNDGGVMTFGDVVIDTVNDDEEY